MIVFLVGPATDWRYGTNARADEEGACNVDFPVTTVQLSHGRKPVLAHAAQSLERDLNLSDATIRTPAATR
jgi:hypothetical protein